MAEEDAVDKLPQSAADRIIDLAKFIEALVQRKQNKDAQKQQQQEKADAQQLQAKQHQELLQAIKGPSPELQAQRHQELLKAMKQSGIPATDNNVKLANEQLKQLEKINDQQAHLKEKMGAVDKKIADIEKQQQDILNPQVDPNKPQTEVPDPSKQFTKLQELNGEKAKLQAEKKPLQEQMDKLEGQRKDIMQGKGMEGMEVDGPSVTQDLDTPTRSRSNALTGKDDPRMPKPGVKDDDETMVQLDDDTEVSLDDETMVELDEPEIDELPVDEMEVDDTLQVPLDEDIGRDRGNTLESDDQTRKRGTAVGNKKDSQMVGLDGQGEGLDNPGLKGGPKVKKGPGGLKQQMGGGMEQGMGAGQKLDPQLAMGNHNLGNWQNKPKSTGFKLLQERQEAISKGHGPKLSTGLGKSKGVKH